MTNKESRWYKQIGGDFGCMKLKNKWVWYDCLHCARYMYPEVFSTPRWQGPPSKAIIRATEDRVYERHHCFGPEMHQKIQNKKDK